MPIYGEWTARNIVFEELINLFSCSALKQCIFIRFWFYIYKLRALLYQ